MLAGMSDRVQGHHPHKHAARIRHLVRPHSHAAADKVDAAMEASAEGIRALWISLAVLGATAMIEAIVVVFSGSVALLGDTLHNGVDALTAVPLGVAFVIGRRPPNRRYTYGYGRAEDLAGLVIIAIIAASSALASIAASTLSAASCECGRTRCRIRAATPERWSWACPCSWGW